MNKPLEILALKKQLLVARSTLCRHRIRHELNALYDPLHWRRAADTLPVGSTVLGLALFGAARGRLSRLLAVAIRTLLFAKLANIAANVLRK